MKVEKLNRFIFWNISPLFKKKKSKIFGFYNVAEIQNDFLGKI